MTIRIVIADDQELIRAGFRMILESEPGLEVVGEAENGAMAIRAAKRDKPDVMLMDIRMPDIDGIEATREISSHGDTPRVLMLTTFDLDDYVYEAIRAGASGFLLKDTPPDDLIAAIRLIAAGEALLAPSVTRRLIEEFARAPRRSVDPGILSNLTEREVDVVRQLAKGLSNAEIATELFVSETTVKTHVSRVLMKLGLRDRVQAVVLAYESGLVVPGATD
jgi:DNA-binding NarL/FixJ family response regulator